MNPILAFLAVIQPFIKIGDSVLLSWVVSIFAILVVVSVIVWGASKVFGPPTPPPAPWSWIIWGIIGLAIVIFLFAAFGVGIP